MKRIIVGFEKLTPNILNLFIDRFPDGYGDNDIIEFKNSTGETIQAVEVKSTDTVYLIKIGKKMNQIIQEFEDEQSELNEDSEFIEEDKDIDPNLVYDHT
jgi:DNA-directed RNA polymerase subunit delta